MTHAQSRKVGPIGWLWEKAREHASNAVIGGGILVVTGFTPEHWAAEIIHALHLSDARSYWPSYIDGRLFVLSAGVAIIVGDMLWRKHRARVPAASVVPATVATPTDPSKGSAAAAADSLTLPDKPSIAVLPFQNMSGDPEQDYFVDGLVEDIITALSRFNSLFVIARNSSFTYKGKAVNIKQVGRELGVRYVLEGSVRKVGSRVRITGQLIECEAGTHLWADRFEGSLEDVFDLQDQVTKSVVGAIATRVDQAEIDRARRKPLKNLNAYDSYLRGVANAYVLSKEGQDEALRHFYRAIELDPDFSTPWGLATRCYSLGKIQGWSVDSDRDVAEIRRLASRVSIIGRDDALALCWAGFVLVRVCRDYDLGTALVDQALSINQNLAVGWINRGIISNCLGEPESAIEQLTRAMRLSPLDPDTFRLETNMAVAHLLQGQYAAAENWAIKALHHQPSWMFALRALAVSRALAGKIDEAREVMARMLQVNPALRLSQMEELLPFRRPQDFARMIEGLRLAGMPE
jgi:TolB-like protein